MSKSERIKMIFDNAKEKGLNQPLSTFYDDMHTLAKIKYSHLDKWEKLARSMAGAIVSKSIY